MLCKNTGSSPAKFSIDGHPGQPPRRYEVPPGDTVDIPDGYAQEYVSDSRRKMPAIITQICPAMKPLGERAKGQLPTVAAVNDQTGQGDVLAALAKVNAQLASLAEDNRALRRENMNLRGTHADGGASIDEAVAAADAKPATEGRRKAAG